MERTKEIEPKEFGQKLREWLSHPLLLLIVGALISSYLIPSLTRQWQINEKELEIKTALVSQIGEAVASIMTTAQLAEVRNTSQTRQEYDEAFRRWEMERAVIGAQIQAYFPQTQIGSEWEPYCRVLIHVYRFSGTDDPTDKATFSTKSKLADIAHILSVQIVCIQF